MTAAKDNPNVIDLSQRQPAPQDRLGELIKLVRGKARDVHPLMWVVALLFVAYFAIHPLTALLT